MIGLLVTFFSRDVKNDDLMGDANVPECVTGPLYFDEVIH